MEGDAPAVSAVQTREAAHSEKFSLDAFVTRRDDLRAVRDASWSRCKQGCEEVLERYEHDYEEALEQLRDDIFDARLDNLDETYEEALREGKYDQEALYWEEVENLVIECSALGFERDSSAEEEEEDEGES